LGILSSVMHISVKLFGDCFNQHHNQPDGPKEGPHDEVADEFKHFQLLLRDIVHITILRVLSANPSPKFSPGVFSRRKKIYSQLNMRKEKSKGPEGPLLLTSLDLLLPRLDQQIHRF
jgi:hypothetical protein